MSLKTLYLLRHARTQEKLPDQSDFERELSPIGLQNSTRMGIQFSKHNINIDMIVSSPAKRAEATATLIAEQIKFDTDRIHFNDSIYEASVRTLLQLINNFKDSWNTVLLVAHNPSISYLAEYISDSQVGNLTTCGVVKINFENFTWGKITEKSGAFQSYDYPDLLNF